MAVAPDVAPVMTSPFLKEPAVVFSSNTNLSPASKPKLSVLSIKTKLVAVVPDSKTMLSMSVIDSKFN